MTVFSVALLSDLPTTITLGGTAWSLFFIGIDLAKQSFQLLGASPDGSGAVSYTHLTLPTNREV